MSAAARRNRAAPEPTLRDGGPASEKRPGQAGARRLPDAVLRAMRNAPPGRPDTDEEQALFAERRREERISAEAQSAEIAEECRRT